MDEPAALVDGKHERADRLRYGRRGHEPGDNELLPLGAFRLEPIAAATRAVGQVAALRDDALEPEPAGVPEHRCAIGLDMIAEADRAAGGRVVEQAGKQRLALDQGRVGELVAAEIEQVESSNLISCTHSPPTGACAASVARHGSTKGGRMPFLAPGMRARSGGARLRSLATLARSALSA